ncbi:MAG: DUF362 domain-containing protein [Erysipelotrichaceae bacterium]|nr:DUF362 domain-containing protein [Erysipelotrichaceae bacterium]
MTFLKTVAGKDGNVYIPMDKRTGKTSVVYFTRDLSANGLKKIYAKVNENLEGKIAVKLHTGEKNGPNIIPREWVKELMDNMPNSTIIETNTYYEGDRYTTPQHLETLKVNGWTFAPVDITDAEGVAMLPVKDGKWFTEMGVGQSMLQYDSLLALTHFKGHAMGGFGGSNKNLGIGCADGRVGKKMIHASDTDQWGIVTEELMEKIAESTKATVDFFGKNVAFINVMRNMSVSCDCEGVSAAPVVTPNIGIVASLDIVAVDQASVDLVYALKPEEHKDLVERIESRHGLRQLSYMQEMGMGNTKYVLVDLDHEQRIIEPKEAVKDVVPFE